ncbi:MAG TPA: aminotransferase class V-fold PLP-dependent enzyme [Terracidiphilus sp.]|jgi:selenocysteine lyase/cysteine desulfurase
MAIIPLQRHLFDIPDDVAYFNSAYYSPQLNESRRRLLAGVGQKSRPWERMAADFFGDADKIRDLAARIFGGDADGYAILPSSSYGLSTAARVLEPHLCQGDRILYAADEFPSGVLPWIRTAQETGAVSVAVPAPEDGDWTHAILAHMDKGVKVVAASTCHWTNGATVDLVSIAKACREVGSALVVDATQSLGAMPLCLDEVQPDFLVSSGYKWLLCPYGFALFFVAEQWRNARPLEETWLTRDNARDFTALANYSGNYLPGARRFDVGETCTPTILPGAVAALEQIEEWGVTNIAESLKAINEKIAALLEGHGFILPEPNHRSPHLFGARMPADLPENLVVELKARNVFVSQRSNSIRIAPHLHCSAGDVDRFQQALEQISRKRP